MSGSELGYQLLCWGWPPGTRPYTRTQPRFTAGTLSAYLGSRIGEALRGKSVLLLGCAHPEICVEVALQNPALLAVVDHRERYRHLAAKHLDQAGLADRCEILAAPRAISEVILALDSFERTDQAAAAFDTMERWLAPGGKIYLAYGPPWYHPFGGNSLSVFPWSHLLFSREALLRWHVHNLNGSNSEGETNPLGRLTVRALRDAVEESPFFFEHFETVPAPWFGWLSNRLTREILTVNVRATLIRRAHALTSPRRRLTFVNRLPRPWVGGAKELLLGREQNFFSQLYTGVATCLMYHSLTTERIHHSEYHPNQGIMVHVDNFEEQLRYLRANSRCLALGTAIDKLRQGSMLPSSTVLTFDDGYRDNLTLMLPLLERYEIPATIFISTSTADGNFELWWHELGFIIEQMEQLHLHRHKLDIHWQLRTPAEKFAAFTCLNAILANLGPQEQEELLDILRRACTQTYSPPQIALTWQDLEKLAKHPLITIGSHSRRHWVLSRLPKDLLAQEFRESKRILEERLGLPIRFLCYPFGGSLQVGRREFTAAAEAGYESALTTRVGHWFPNHNKHLFSLPRIAVSYFDDLTGFRWKMSGLEAMRQHCFKRVVTE